MLAWLGNTRTVAAEASTATTTHRCTKPSPLRDKKNAEKKISSKEPVSSRGSCSPESNVLPFVLITTFFLCIAWGGGTNLLNQRKPGNFGLQFWPHLPLEFGRVLRFPCRSQNCGKNSTKIQNNRNVSFTFGVNSHFVVHTSFWAVILHGVVWLGFEAAELKTTLLKSSAHPAVYQILCSLDVEKLPLFYQIITDIFLRETTNEASLVSIFYFSKQICEFLALFSIENSFLVSFLLLLAFHCNNFLQFSSIFSLRCFCILNCRDTGDILRRKKEKTATEEKTEDKAQIAGKDLDVADNKETKISETNHAKQKMKSPSCFLEENRSSFNKRLVAHRRKMPRKLVGNDRD